MLEMVFNALFTFIPVLLAIAFFILAERKLLAAIQRRHGPEITGFHGLFQSFVDGLKLMTKEAIFPYGASKLMFLYASICIFLVSLTF